MGRTHNLFSAIILAVAVGLTAAQDAQPEAAPSGGERPKAAQRVVKSFDFEEWLTNPLEVPAGWVRAQHDPLVPRDRPGFPIWNKPALDYDVAARGDGSVRLPIKGGSASLRLNPGVLPIFPLGRYSITAKVRSEGLLHARPRLVVRALDGTGKPIAGSERLTIADSVGSQWQPIGVELPGFFAEAAYLQIDLEVVQPREFLPETVPGHQVWEEDFEGAAWFDDVIVMQVPQLYLKTTSVLNVVARPDVPVLAAELRDLAAQDMTATIRVYNASRELIDTTQRQIVTGRSAWEWKPELGALGWYRAVIDITAEGRVISTEACDFVWVDEPEHAQPDYDTGPAFSGVQTKPTGRAWRPVGVELRSLPPATPDELARTLTALGVDSVTLPVWEPGVTVATFPARVDLLRSMLSAIRDAWIDTELSLVVIPDELAAALHIGTEDVLDVFAANAATWEPALLDALDRLGTTAARWQLGSSGSTNAFDRPNLTTDLTRARSTISAMVPGVELAIGWRADLSPAAARASGADAARIELPAWMGNLPTDAALEPWFANPAPPLPPAPRAEFVLEPLEGLQHTEQDIAADLARRTAELWASASQSSTNENPTPRFTVAISDPWRIEPGEAPTAHPTVTAAVWRNLADRLDGRLFAVEWPIARGVRCLVFTAPLDNPEEGGLIVAWREGAATDNAFLVGMLGKEPVTAYDLFGNSHPLEPTSSADGARIEHRLALTPEPVFVEGINTELVLFLTSVGLDPPVIQSTAGLHEHAVVVQNPWSLPITGRIVITEPGGYNTTTQTRDRRWEITPRSMAFSLAAGESARVPVIISFSRATEAGTKQFVFDVQLVADEDYGWVRSRSEVELLWNDVQLDLTYRLAPGGSGKDLIIEAAVTNTGNTPRALEAIAFAPAMPRGRASIGTLEPGQSVIRRFAFPEGLTLLAGKRVLVSVSEPNGSGRLTKGIEVPKR